MLPEEQIDLLKQQMHEMDQDIENYLDEIFSLKKELEKEVQSHVDTASVLSNVIKENRQIKGAYDDKCEDIEGYLQTLVDIRKVLYSCSKLEDKIKEIEEIIIFGYDNNEESENRTLEDWLR